MATPPRPLCGGIILKFVGSVVLSLYVPTSMETGKRKQTDIVDEPTRAKKKAKPITNKVALELNDSPPANSSSATSNLHALLDFSSLNDESAISNRFDEIARVLIHEYHLVVSHGGVETAFEIQEMEFYLQKGKCHEDPYTHGSEEQKISGRWCAVAPYAFSF